MIPYKKIYSIKCTPLHISFDGLYRNEKSVIEH